MIVIDGVYQKVVKQSNRRKIFNHIKKKRSITKLDLARDLDLSITTVSSNIKLLKERGFINDSEYDESTGGRKARIIELLPNARYTIGFELKENHARVVLVNLDHVIVHEENVESIDLSRVPEETVRIIDSFIETHDVLANLAGIGISLPGIVDSEKKTLVNAPNMKVENIDFSTVIDHFSVPVYIENEANCAAFAEFHESNADESLFYISITEGIGGALIINNHLINGRYNRAGEVGHMIIVKDGLKCHCGNSGCWEQYASEHALKELIRNKTGRHLTIAEAFGLYESDESIKSCIDEYAENIAAGLCNILMMFDPGKIIIGGNVASYSKILCPVIREWLLQRTHFYSATEILIGFSSFGRNAGVIGAALFPLVDMF